VGWTKGEVWGTNKGDPGNWEGCPEGKGVEWDWKESPNTPTMFIISKPRSLPSSHPPSSQSPPHSPLEGKRVGGLGEGPREHRARGWEPGRDRCKTAGEVEARCDL